MLRRADDHQIGERRMLQQPFRGDAVNKAPVPRHALVREVRLGLGAQLVGGFLDHRHGRGHRRAIEIPRRKHLVTHRLQAGDVSARGPRNIQRHLQTGLQGGVVIDVKQNRFHG
jgi:hypothetical protein